MNNIIFNKYCKEITQMSKQFYQVCTYFPDIESCPTVKAPISVFSSALHSSSQGGQLLFMK